MIECFVELPDLVFAFMAGCFPLFRAQCPGEIAVCHIGGEGNGFFDGPYDAFGNQEPNRDGGNRRDRQDRCQQTVVCARDGGHLALGTVQFVAVGIGDDDPIPLLEIGDPGNDRSRFGILSIKPVISMNGGLPGCQ